ncbi:hypothetical protein ANANG_G00181110 [Anguilla anguilla]|uniref:Uncharacterized protein n=1 Tax=Anguilla anguilla TaxID=7936 RepID=A0A9D3RTR6_ANGAN|nr:hypothetical protein ANANG_G00181110 [Anguilla anguilla]
MQDIPIERTCRTSPSKGHAGRPHRNGTRGGLCRAGVVEETPCPPHHISCTTARVSASRNRVPGEIERQVPFLRPQTQLTNICCPSLAEHSFTASRKTFYSMSLYNVQQNI